MRYEISASLDEEIDGLEALLSRYRHGQCDATLFRAHRVPFGVYEQRRKGSFMVRVRTPAGVIRPAQLSTVAALSAQYGADRLHLTTRQELQIHDVDIENLATIIRQLRLAGLSTRGGGGNTVRNIVASPDSGLFHDEVFDVTPHAIALTTRLIAESESWGLPRKYKIAFSCSAMDSGRARFHDLGFIASTSAGARGFRVYVAGGLGAKSQIGHLLHEFVPENDVYVVARAIRQLFDKFGNRRDRHAARLRFLWNQLGEREFIARYRVELEDVRSQHPALLTVPEEPSEPRGASARSRAATESAMTEGSRTTAQSVATGEFALWKRRYVMPQRQPGRFSLLLPVAFGDLRKSEVDRLIEVLTPLGDDVIRITFGQNLRLRNLPESCLEGVYEIGKQISKSTGMPRLLGQAISCTGADTCQLGLCLSKGALAAVAQRLAEDHQRGELDLDEIPDFRLHISGCPNNCGQHALADLGFSGKARRQDQHLYPAYKIHVGARTGQDEPRLATEVGEVSARDLPAFVAGILSNFIPRRKAYNSFGAYVQAEGRSELLRLLEKYGRVPSFEEDRSYYIDWGSSETFSLVGKGSGECSTGMSDLIELDRKRIQVLRSELSNSASPENQGARRLELCLCAARMLLVTRGVEPASDPATFDAFLSHFIDTGLVLDRFRPVVQAGRSHDGPALELLEKDLFALADAVDSLYRGMDASLRFAVPAPDKPVTAPCESHQFGEKTRDYRHVACPMNFVKVKLDLDGLQAGQLLRVLLDDGAPIQSVSRSVAEEGHEIVDQARVEDHWAMVIRKVG